jgi:hypothetical protein
MISGYQAQVTGYQAQVISCSQAQLTWELDLMILTNAVKKLVCVL